MVAWQVSRIPLIQAPMAGGGSTPELVAAVGAAGALGFLAAGYRTAENVRGQIAQVRAATDAPFGVNVFVPSDPGDEVYRVAAYRRVLAASEPEYAQALGTAASGDDDWAAKIQLLCDERVPVAGFTFGCPDGETVSRLHRAGTQVVVTVTSAEEARLAAAAGADAVCAQGAEAGGHRATFRNVLDDTGLLPLLHQVREAVDLPVIAAGGLGDGRDVAAVLAAGAAAAQLGTVFLACPESGAAALHVSALTDPAFEGTRVTRAFSGRPARGLANRFLVEHSAEAPAAYPHVHQITAPLRAAASSAGDPQAMALWAGQSHGAASGVPAGELVETLWTQATAALADAARRWTD